MDKKLEAFLAPLLDIDWSSWGVQRLGLLERPLAFGQRYVSIPAEAVPLAGLGADGCHYAAWIDDPGSVLRSPGVVLVSPMDPYPDAIQWVASSVDVFAKLIQRDDLWLLRSDPGIAGARARAVQDRAAAVTAMTADGMGVVERGLVERQADELIGSAASIGAAIHRLVAEGALAEALVLVRNVIAGAPQPRGFASAVAAVYTALRRPEYAAVALASYED